MLSVFKATSVLFQLRKARLLIGASIIAVLALAGIAYGFRQWHNG